MEYFILNNGVKMPKIGYGTYKIPADIAKNAVTNALNVGYRHIDTATYYNNESAIGDAIRASNINREEIFITSKIWTTANTYDLAVRSIEDSLIRLHTSYLDLALIHWPTAGNNEVWRALEDLYRDGLIKAIGVSNFKQHHIDSLLETAKVCPMVNQVELHPYFQQKGLRDYCAEHNIQVEAWSPLLRGGLLFDAKLNSLALKYNKTISQIVLRFLLQEGISANPMTLNSSHLCENINIFDFEISDSDMELLRTLNTNMRYYRDPDRHGF